VQDPIGGNTNSEVLQQDCDTFKILSKLTKLAAVCTQTVDLPMILTKPELLIWSESMSLGNPRLDDEHEHLTTLIAHLQAASDEGLHAALKAVLDDATAHFSAENDLMTATGFPPRECHIKEHDAVLATLHGVTKRLAQGDHEVVRQLSTQLAAWFPGHVQHLDSALFHWLCKLQHGGKPVVLHIGGDKGSKSRGPRDAAPASV